MQGCPAGQVEWTHAQKRSPLTWCTTVEPTVRSQARNYLQQVPLPGYANDVCGGGPVVSLGQISKCWRHTPSFVCAMHRVSAVYPRAASASVRELPQHQPYFGVKLRVHWYCLSAVLLCSSTHKSGGSLLRKGDPPRDHRVCRDPKRMRCATVRARHQTNPKVSCFPVCAAVWCLRCAVYRAGPRLEERFAYGFSKPHILSLSPSTPTQPTATGNFPWTLLDMACARPNNSNPSSYTGQCAAAGLKLTLW